MEPRPLAIGCWCIRGSFMSLPTTALRPVLDAAAAWYELPWWNGRPPSHLLEALVMAESSGNLRARRYEPHQDVAGRSDAATDADAPGADNGLREDDSSYGIFQVMGTNIRGLVGNTGRAPMDFDFAYDLFANIYLGCAVLRRELKATGNNVERALARYNGGPSGDRLINGRMRRQDYVDVVARRLEQVTADRGLKTGAITPTEGNRT